MLESTIQELVDDMHVYAALCSYGASYGPGTTRCGTARTLVQAVLNARAEQIKKRKAIKKPDPVLKLAKRLSKSFWNNGLEGHSTDIEAWKRVARKAIKLGAVAK